MKIKVEFLAGMLLLLGASAWAAKWTIDSFDDSPEPGEPDNYIAQESGGGLKPVQPEQVTLQSGRLYVRQKFEDPFGDEEATYQIFQGRPTEAAKGLGKISLEGIPYATLLKMKLFYSRTATGDDDLEVVYYDGKDIFVEGEDPVYINLNGKMEELKPVALKDYKISITSDPSGATVTVGGVSKGATPASFSVPSSKTIAVVVSKDGYYTVIKPITPADKQTTQEGVLLTKKTPLENPAATFRSRLQTAVSSKKSDEIKTIKSEVQKILNNYTAESKKFIDAAMKNFPANPPKAASESPADFSTRQSLWTNTQSMERDALNKESQNNFTELKDFLAEVDAALGDMDFALKYEYIPYSAISVTNLGIKDLTLDVEVSNSRVKFKYDKAKLAYGSVPRNDIAQDQENVHGVLKIWNVPNENGKFASIYDIAFFYNETPLKILTKGTYTMSEATSASRNTERDLNTRIAKHSGKAAWDKNDEAATLAALRKGEIPDAAAPPPPPKQQQQEVAYYDEEEDEEEFEEEMEEQEEYDYSRSSAGRSASDVFGNTDEYLFWTGMLFAAAAIGTGVVGFLQNMKYIEANTAWTNAKEKKDEIEKSIRSKCEEKYSNPDDCYNEFEKQALTEGATHAEYGTPIDAFYRAGQLMDKNGKTRDSYNQARIIWWSAAGLSAALSITLFAW
jgi:Skp family chaperone for outer membrane proteins